MSRETLTHLNTQTLIGYTSKRGQAWHVGLDRRPVEQAAADVGHRHA